MQKSSKMNDGFWPDSTRIIQKWVRMTVHFSRFFLILALIVQNLR
jgi:hypothetical protein